MTAYTLNGFRQQLGYRVFGFLRREGDAVPVHYTVKADLVLIRKYRIPIQELPLLCRVLLERQIEPQSARDFTFGEDEMRAYARETVLKEEAVAARRKAAHRNPSGFRGAAWRTPAAGHPNKPEDPTRDPN